MPSGQPFHARHRDGPGRRHDRGAPPDEQRPRRGRFAAGLSLAVILAAPAAAETLRIATYNTGLSRRGPGLLLRDILEGRDAQAEAVAEVIAAAHPDVLLLTGIDYDLGLAALSALADRVAANGGDYPHRFAFRPNTGMTTDLDLDGDGRLRGPGDSQGFGAFAGEGGMAVLSRLPIDAAAARDFSDFLWRDLPGALIDGAGLSPEAEAIQRLSTTGHWDIPVILPTGDRLSLLAYYATPPVFDGPEDRNGRRNHDETAFWSRFLDGDLPFAPTSGVFVILGDANLDPMDGEGRPEAIAALLSDPRLRHPAPLSRGGAAAALQGGPNARQKGDPALDTADWDETRGIGNMRVDYVLPSADLDITGSGVWWPAPGEDGAEAAEAASRHRLVWVDVELP
ncbi:endonuclease/exonuclease/phosphatase family protein [Ostreiculturibacter nitratireducens]|uniref:endonuclease/exonuclease/phosphatase family protein n=1 Tax=Ostreiculturibacter nitratireducens TaxID=3075226 RepID=UPI0031B633A5